MKTMVRNLAKKLTLVSLAKLEDGFLRIHVGDETHELGDPGAELRANVHVHDERFFTRALFNFLGYNPDMTVDSQPILLSL